MEIEEHFESREEYLEDVMEQYIEYVENLEEDDDE
jgi:vacuolar-type H+-ATPase subunit E/Vma4